MKKAMDTEHVCTFTYPAASQLHSRGHLFMPSTDLPQFQVRIKMASAPHAGSLHPDSVVHANCPVDPGRSPS